MTLPPTVLFDSNVLFSIRLTSLLMELAMSGLFRARWSPHIHKEWMDAVSRECGVGIGQLAARRDAMDAAIPEACVDGYEPLIDALALPDADDRHILAAAIRGAATAIVTFNEKDFPAAAIRPYGMRTWHPDDFMLDMDRADQGSLIDAARADRAHYQNPPLSVEEYVDGLRKCGVPRTAEYLFAHGIR